MQCMRDCVSLCVIARVIESAVAWARAVHIIAAWQAVSECITETNLTERSVLRYSEQTETVQGDPHARTAMERIH